MENQVESTIKEPIKWVEKKSWDEFRKTGLFMFINSILHAFGWALVVEVDYDKETKTETSLVKNCYPARVKYRGFDESDQAEMHKRIGNYLNNNSEELQKEASL